MGHFNIHYVQTKQGWRARHVLSNKQHKTCCAEARSGESLFQCSTCGRYFCRNPNHNNESVEDEVCLHCYLDSQKFVDRIMPRTPIADDIHKEQLAKVGEAYVARTLDKPPEFSPNATHVMHSTKLPDGVAKTARAWDPKVHGETVTESEKDVYFHFEKAHPKFVEASDGTKVRVVEHKLSDEQLRKAADDAIVAANPDDYEIEDYKPEPTGSPLQVFLGIVAIGTAIVLIAMWS